VIGVARPDLPQREAIDAHRTLVRLPRKLFAKRNSFIAKVVGTLEWSIRVLAYLRGRKLSCINAHSLAVLPLCVAACALTGARLVYDTHELETEASGRKGLHQKIGRWVESILIRRSDMVFTVSDSIAKWYACAYAILPPTVVRNIPQVQQPASLDLATLRKKMGLRPDRIVFIYQGGFLVGRGVERLLRVFAALPEFDLVCMGSGPLQAVITQAAAEQPNIHLIPPVAPHEVLNYSRVADVGMCLTENSCLSYYYSLPNKLFEYLHAGLPVIVSPLLEQEQLVSEFRCGWVAPEDDTAFIKMLRKIDVAAITARREGINLATQSLQWNEEKARLIQTYKEHGFG